jgi:hypothetical protein
MEGYTMRRRNPRAEAAARQQTWRLALLERRVVRFFFGEHQIFETQEEAATRAAAIEGAQVVTEYKG